MSAPRLFSAGVGQGLKRRPCPTPPSRSRYTLYLTGANYRSGHFYGAGAPDPGTIDGDNFAGGGGATTAAPGGMSAQNYSQAQAAWIAAQKAVLKNASKLFDKECGDVMKALGVEKDDWISAIEAMTFADGTTSDVAMKDLYRNSSISPRPGDADLTIAQFFANANANPRPGFQSAAAVAQLGGSTVYINWKATDPSAVYNNQTHVMHEALHNFTADGDQGLARALSTGLRGTGAWRGGAWDGRYETASSYVESVISMNCK